MMLKLKLQYFGHFMGRVDSLEQILMLGGIGGRRRRGRLLEITSEMTQNKTHKRQTRHNSGWRKKEVLKQAAVYFYKAP